MDYYEENKTYRQKLIEFKNACEKTKLKIYEQQQKYISELQQQIRVLLTQRNELRQLNAQVIEIEVEISKLGNEEKDQTTEIEQLKKDKSMLETQIESLNAQIIDLTERFETTSKDANECDANIKDMTLIANEFLQTLKTNLENEPKLTYPSVPEETNIASVEEIKESMNTEPRGVFILSKIKCDDDLPIKLIAEQTDELIQFEIPGFRKVEKSTKSNPTFTLLKDDQEGNIGCTENWFYKEQYCQKEEWQRAENNIKTALGYADSRVSIPSLIKSFEDAIQDLKKWIKEEKKRIEFAFEYENKEETKINKFEHCPAPPIRSKTFQTTITPTYGRGSVGSMAAALETTKNPSSLTQWLTKTDLMRNLQMKDLNLIPSKSKKDEANTAFETFKNDFISLEIFAENEIKSFENTLLIGKQFIENSIISFLALPGVLEKINTVTILAVGGSGSGKTTVAKSLFAFVMNSFLTTNRQFIEQATISISFVEIYLNSTTGKANHHFLSIKPPTKNPTYSGLDQFESLVSDDNIPEWNVVCEKPECNKLISRDVKILNKLKAMQDISDKYRQVRVTPNNDSGSSRSVKITRLLFEGNGKKFIINLVDTAGYETYTREELTTFYNKIAQTMLPPKPNATKIEEYVNKTLAEGKFIQESLNYLKKVVFTYNNLQYVTTRPYRKKKEFDNDDTFTQELNKETQDGLAWMIEYLPRNATLIVLTTFKASMKDKDESSSAQSTINFLDGILR